MAQSCRTLGGLKNTVMAIARGWSVRAPPHCRGNGRADGRCERRNGKRGKKNKNDPPNKRLVDATLTWRFFHKIERSAVHDRRILAQRDGRFEGARGVLSGHDGRPGSSGWRFRRVRRRETGHVDKFPVSAATRTRTKIAALDGAAVVPGRRTATVFFFF